MRLVVIFLFVFEKYSLVFCAFLSDFSASGRLIDEFVYVNQLALRCFFLGRG